MKKISLSDVKPYEAPGHFKMTALKLHGREESGAKRFWLGLSHFLPQGGAEFSSTPTEKIYFVLEGEVTVKTETQEVVLGPYDSLYVGENEGRSIINNTNKPASMLVIINNPD